MEEDGDLCIFFSTEVLRVVPCALGEEMRHRGSLGRVFHDWGFSFLGFWDMRYSGGFRLSFYSGKMAIGQYRGNESGQAL